MSVKLHYVGEEGGSFSGSMDVIGARRQRIADLARCQGCGTDAKTCARNRKVEGPEGLCCWGGIPGHSHIEDTRLVDELLREVAAGEVRTVEEVYPAPVLGPDRPGVHWLLWQDTWWYPHRRPAVRIAEMDKPHRLNTANWLERKAALYVNAEYNRMIFGPQPGGDMACDAFDRELDEMREHPITWLRGVPLMRALRKGLPGSGSKLIRLQARALHWSTCPMRLAHPHTGDRCVCIRDGARTVGATNDPTSLPRRDPMRSTETYPEPS